MHCVSTFDRFDASFPLPPSLAPLHISPSQFEYQQAQLEVEIENLSWKVERAETTDIGVRSEGDGWGMRVMGGGEGDGWG